MIGSDNQLDQAVDLVRRETNLTPKTGLILGSGLSGLAGWLNSLSKSTTAACPAWPPPPWRVTPVVSSPEPWPERRWLCSPVESTTTKAAP